MSKDSTNIKLPIDTILTDSLTLPIDTTVVDSIPVNTVNVPEFVLPQIKERMQLPSNTKLQHSNLDIYFGKDGKPRSYKYGFWDPEGVSLNIEEPKPGELHQVAVPKPKPTVPLWRRYKTSRSIEDIQKALNTMGAGLTVDGKMGPKTLAAIKAFQTKSGLKADGLWGKNTEAAMAKYGMDAVAARNGNGVPERELDPRIVLSPENAYYPLTPNDDNEDEDTNKKVLTGGGKSKANVGYKEEGAPWIIPKSVMYSKKGGKMKKCACGCKPLLARSKGGRIITKKSCK